MKPDGQKLHTKSFELAAHSSIYNPASALHCHDAIALSFPQRNMHHAWGTTGFLGTCYDSNLLYSFNVHNNVLSIEKSLSFEPHPYLRVTAERES